eukprot:NODE_1458_length_1326_cov_51.622185_g1445_i0.p1 GENE.NODE_1458_length_1326_cov_51.622185_g1445_i0~~NODE_1458_length_1326_cov_51.622185_g1445_i0.p1  ORF type:complete len:420 (-),score=139.03 NODE_1458_length_1326_cov_51.622185_g1445_i0:67-1290(-)
MKFVQLETVDVSAFTTAAAAPEAARAATAAEVRRSLSATGFLYITGHGVSKQLLADVRRVVAWFFAQPTEDKMRCFLPHSPHPRGYSPEASENVASLMGRQGRPDPVEKFSVGFEAPLVLDSSDGGTVDILGGAEQLAAAARGDGDDGDRLLRASFAPNVWPDGQAEFREVLTRYFSAAFVLGQQLMALFAAALDVPADTFARQCLRSSSSLRLLRYPAVDVDECDVDDCDGDDAAADDDDDSERKDDDAGDDSSNNENNNDDKNTSNSNKNERSRMAWHTDLGTVTLLAMDELGLQVQVEDDGDWLWVPVPKEGALVVNVGDVMSHWTNGKWVSTRHRVVCAPAKQDAETKKKRVPPRTSIVFFHQPAYDAVIEPVQVGDGETALPTLKWGEFCAEKMNKMYDKKK